MSNEYNSRKRNWFITVNKGADCYEDFENLSEYEYFYYLAHTVKLIHYVDTHSEELRKLAQQF